VPVPTDAEPSIEGVVDDGGSTVVTSPLVSAMAPVRVLNEVTPVAGAEMTPDAMVMVVPSILTPPSTAVLAVGNV